MNSISYPRPFDIVRPTRNATARRRLRQFVERWRQRWGQAATQRLLAAMDDIELRDIGLTRAEIGSLAAEVHGAAQPTRVHAVRRAANAGLP